jgi:hypothetical protein
MGMNKLLDKQIKLYLYDTEGGTGAPTDIITMPAVGMKPNIGINAEFITSEVVQNPMIRLTNFYPSKPLSDYKWFQCLAGYRDSPDWAGFEGQVWIAYQESPSPDGVTLISCAIANMTDVYNAKIDLHVEKNTYLSEVFTNIKNALTDNTGVQWSLENSLPDIQIPMQLDFTGYVKDLLANLKKMFGFQYGYEGKTLVIYSINEGRTAIDPVKINYLSSPPTQAAVGVTFAAPWMPELRPGMQVYIDPVYFKQKYDATKVDISSTLVCQTINVEFNTVTQQNIMTVLALNIAEIPNKGTE